MLVFQSTKMPKLYSKNVMISAQIMTYYDQLLQRTSIEYSWRKGRRKGRGDGERGRDSGGGAGARGD